MEQEDKVDRVYRLRGRRRPTTDPAQGCLLTAAAMVAGLGWLDSIAGWLWWDGSPVQVAAWGSMVLLTLWPWGRHYDRERRRL